MPERPYTFTHVHIDADGTLHCDFCGATETVNSPPGIATIETEAFVNNHRPCAGEAA